MGDYSSSFVSAHTLVIGIEVGIGFRLEEPTARRRSKKSKVWDDPNIFDADTDTDPDKSIVMMNSYPDFSFSAFQLIWG